MESAEAVGGVGRRDGVRGGAGIGPPPALIYAASVYIGPPLAHPPARPTKPLE